MGARSSQSRGPGLNKTDGHLLEYFRQTFGAGGGGNSGPNVAPPGNQGIEATGGTISDYTQNGKHYRAHVFTTSGSFNVSAVEEGDVEYLVVAGGGGGGGGYYGGGGGAGGVRTNLAGHALATGNEDFTVAAGQNYDVVVGAGGRGGLYSGASNDGSPAEQGSDSRFGPSPSPQVVIAKGGGKGMGRETSVSGATDGYPGGSGGGTAYRAPAVGYGYNPSTPSPIVPSIPASHPYGITQGYPSGATSTTNTYGSGGGGAGGPGAVGGGYPTPNDNFGADGGAGTQILIAGPDGAGAPGPGSTLSLIHI